MSSNRRKPFSHKQKKQQLLEKRRRDQSQPRQHQLNDELTSEEVACRATEQSRSAGFVRIFLPESQDDVDKAKAEAQLPLASHVRPFPQLSLFLDPEYCPDLPPRPSWTYETTAEELHRSEEHHFSEWLCSLATKVEDEKLTFKNLSYFETNLDAYRQLWRATERGQVICICLDARIPLAHCPVSVIRYIRFVLKKPFIFAMNKGDLATQQHINNWKQYLMETYSECAGIFVFGIKDHIESGTEAQQFLSFIDELAIASDEVTVTFIGQPSVGKSSLMNRLVGKKVTGTKRTPGTTKYFQTYYLRKDSGALPNVVLCDAPGIVFPVKTTYRSVQIVCGVVPIGRVREFFSSLRFLWEHCHGFKEQLGLSSLEGHTPYSVLEELAEKRGFLGKGGRVDVHRIGQQILRDVIDGKFVFMIDQPI
ncbi:hypothetical protein P9112_011073 [Eukaryota sp. TZLM1-RC]